MLASIPVRQGGSAIVPGAITTCQALGQALPCLYNGARLRHALLHIFKSLISLDKTRQSKETQRGKHTDKKYTRKCLVKRIFT